MQRRLVAGVVVGILIFGFVACDDNDGDDGGFPVREPAASPTTGSGPVIGLVGSFLGDDGWRGEDAFEGVDVAVQVLNRESGPSEQSFTLVGLDDESNPERATQLIEELAASERTVGIVYAGPAEGIAAAEPALEAAGIPGVLVFEDLYSARLLRSHLFQVSPPYLWQARRIASYLLRDRRYRRIGVLVQDSLAGDTAEESTRTALRDFGGRAAVVVRFPVGDIDLSDEIAALRAQDVEAIVFQGMPRAGRVLFEELRDQDAAYVDTEGARTVTAPKRRRKKDTEWRPQIATFDGIISPLSGVSGLIPPGTVAADTYARGAHYLPIPALREFRENFVAWWDAEPLGWQRRSYEATLMIGWAARRSEPGEDIAGVLETLSGERMGGLDVSFGPDDHTAVTQTTVGLWVVPRRTLAVREQDDLPANLPWVMLSRGFSTGGTRTDVAPRDWDYLFEGSYRADGPAPRLTRARFGVATPRRDPVH